MPETQTSTADGSLNPDLSGRRIGDYQVLRRLGRGGMAEVYLAEQLSLRRQVAFKVLKPHLAKDDAYVRRFDHEAQAAASLVHANIVQIHEVGCIDGIHFIAQEYVAGQNLKQWLLRHRSADAPTAVHIMRQVIAALHRASEHGIIHRDIKPENIMLAKTGEVKVADFGLARVVSQSGAVNLTQVGVTMGTPLYMSPEQVEGHHIDPRSDIYSLGITCYEMLAGQPPFDGETPLSVAVQHLHNQPARLENQRPDLPSALCRIVHKMVEKDPDQRYQSATELMRDLRAIHVEGLDQWPTSSEQWDTPELLALADVRCEMTQRLDCAMKFQAAGTQKRGRRASIAALILVGIVIGTGVAWMGRPTDLLAVNAPSVERKKTVYLQYWYAYELNSELGWKSVDEYFPPDNPINQLYAWRSKQRLAEWYREKNQPQQAQALYQELANLAPEEPQLAASGLVGQANLYAQRGDMTTASAKLAAAMPLVNSLRPDQQDIVVRQLDPELRPKFGELARDFANIEKVESE